MNLKGQERNYMDFIKDALPVDVPGKLHPLYQSILFLFYE